MKAASWLAVAVGGAIGTLARYGIGLLIPPAADTFPWATFTVNTVGSFLLGLLAAGTWRVVPPWLRAGLGAGVLGAFTTYSTLMAAAVVIAQGGELAYGPGSVEPGDFGLASIAILASMFAGLAAALVGIIVGRRFRSPVRTVDDAEDA